MGNIITSYEIENSGSYSQVMINSFNNDYFSVLIANCDLDEFERQFKSKIYGNEFSSIKKQFDGRIYDENDIK